VRRADELNKRGVHDIDAGMSGGLRGLELGYCSNGLWLRGGLSA
jgi:6-phosphogluconate dehydrogenase (decarboxylating)